MGKHLHTFIHKYINTSKTKYQAYTYLKVTTEVPFLKFSLKKYFNEKRKKYLEIYYKRYRDLKN